MPSSTYRIGGLHCEACAKLVSKHVKKIEGVEDASVVQGVLKVQASRDILSEEVERALAGSDYSLLPQ